MSFRMNFIMLLSKTQLFITVSVKNKRYMFFRNVCILSVFNFGRSQIIQKKLKIFFWVPAFLSRHYYYFLNA